MSKFDETEAHIRLKRAEGAGEREGEGQGQGEGEVGHVPQSIYMTNKSIAENISLPTFRPYISEDVIGAQIGGATKNVIAIAAGVVEGQKMGDSARAATIARGFSEIKRLAISMGGKEETLAGLSGMGDLLLTCNSKTSRNYSLGIQLGEGKSIEEATNGLSTIAEGMYSAKAITSLAEENGVDMPITLAVNDLIEKKYSVTDIIDNLLNRPIKKEN